MKNPTGLLPVGVLFLLQTPITDSYMCLLLNLTGCMMQSIDRLLMPAFGTAAIRDMFDDMVDIASQLVLKWERYVFPLMIHRYMCPEYGFVDSDLTIALMLWTTIRVSHSTLLPCAPCPIGNVLFLIKSNSLTDPLAVPFHSLNSYYRVGS